MRKWKGTHTWPHWLVVATVFGLTGVTSLAFSRLLFSVLLDLEGSLWSGPWSYRIMYVSVIPPVYSTTLVLFGSLFGKREYFARRAMWMWGWIIIGGGDRGSGRAESYGRRDAGQQSGTERLED